jgi:hypothetical protein
MLPAGVRHMSREKINYLFIASATTAAKAIEFTFTSKESERDVKITGAFVPVRILPFFTSQV